MLAGAGLLMRVLLCQLGFVWGLRSVILQHASSSIAHPCISLLQGGSALPQTHPSWHSNIPMQECSALEEAGGRREGAAGWTGTGNLQDVLSVWVGG